MLTKRCVCQQQRSEIMRYSVQLVNPFVFSLRFALLAAWRCEGQNYSKALEGPQGIFRTNGKKQVAATMWLPPGSCPGFCRNAAPRVRAVAEAIVDANMAR
jgi:hypothetical protein